MPDEWDLISEACHQATLALAAMDEAIAALQKAREKLAAAEDALDDANGEAAARDAR